MWTMSSPLNFFRSRVQNDFKSKRFGGGALAKICFGFLKVNFKGNEAQGPFWANPDEVKKNDFLGVCHGVNEKKKTFFRNSNQM